MQSDLVGATTLEAAAVESSRDHGRDISCLVYSDLVGSDLVVISPELGCHLAD